MFINEISGDTVWYLLNDIWTEVRDQGECYDLCENMKGDWDIGYKFYCKIP